MRYATQMLVGTVWQTVAIDTKETLLGHWEQYPNLETHCRNLQIPVRVISLENLCLELGVANYAI